MAPRGHHEDWRNTSLTVLDIGNVPIVLAEAQRTFQTTVGMCAVHKTLCSSSFPSHLSQLLNSPLILLELFNQLSLL
jgi:hypothetical protein